MAASSSCSASPSASRSRPRRGRCAPRPRQTGGVSLGLALGDPTGITLRAGLEGRHAIQAALGYGFFPGDALAVTVDWTYDAWDFFADNRATSLWFYFGAGGTFQWFTGRHFVCDGPRDRFRDNDHVGLGVRGLVGLRAPFRQAPFDLFFELAPFGVAVVIPDPGVFYDFGACIGFRFRF